MRVVYRIVDHASSTFACQLLWIMATKSTPLPVRRYGFGYL